ncbi:unnamed protein product [Sphagnum troendelagicum]|uniref:Uncharacterized protein n=1 Tax=Sphagnum troendelagicum TaxID=128251 RepID=A0ABP0U9S3_9BRYO
MIADHLRASELSAIDTRTPKGLASLTTILGQALQVGLTAGEAQRDEEARKATEAKAAEKKRKRDERATTGALSPRTLEKKRRKDERDAIRKEKLDLKKKEEERKKLPLITLAEEGIPTKLAYIGAKNTIRHIVSTNFARGVEWGTLSKAEQKRVINQVKGAFRNGGELDSQWIADKISNSMCQAKYHDRMKICAHLRDLNVYKNLERPLQFSEDIWNAFYQSEAIELKLAECQSVVDEVGDPPLKFLKAAKRVKTVPNTTHRLGEGGIPSLKAAFVRCDLFRKLLRKCQYVKASEGESESSDGSSDEEERDEEERADSTAPSVLPAPSATTRSGPNSFASRNQGSAGGKDKENREEEEEEEEEGQGDDEEREEDEQPPPPLENTRKKDSRKKSKRGRKS